MLETLQSNVHVTTHLIISKSASITINHELNHSLDEIKSLADHTYPVGDIAACIASGSYPIDGMIIAPCSIKTMSQIANGITDNIISRAADVVLKEQKKLVIMLRETPLHLGHLRNLTSLAEMGAIIHPPVPAFYHRPTTIDDIVNHSVGRALDFFQIEHRLVQRWQGLHPSDLPE